MSECLGLSGVAPLLPLLRELNDLKRLRASNFGPSLAEELFVRAWHRILSGEELTQVALHETAHAVAAARLAAIDARALENAGLDEAQRLQVLARAFDEQKSRIEPAFFARLRAHLSAQPLSEQFMEEAESLPDFVHLLSARPRAGATRPGRGRIVLEPTESHAEHCGIVALNCVLAAPLFGADAGAAFLVGLSHHLHNAQWPDAGDAGDHLVGEFLPAIIEGLRERELSELPAALQNQTRQALGAVFVADTPAAQAFQVGDSLDRVLEMEWHARTSSFTLDVALEEMDIIHPGPVQQFQIEIMRAAGFQ